YQDAAAVGAEDAVDGGRAQADGAGRRAAGCVYEVEVELLVGDCDPVVSVRWQEGRLLADQRQAGLEGFGQRGQGEPADLSAVVGPTVAVEDQDALHAVGGQHEAVAGVIDGGEGVVAARLVRSFHKLRLKKDIELPGPPDHALPEQIAAAEPPNAGDGPRILV